MSIIDNKRSVEFKYSLLKNIKHYVFNAGKAIHGTLAIPNIHHPQVVRAYQRGSGSRQNIFSLHRNT